MMSTEPIRIAHVIYRLAIGGMENGLVNLVNRMDPQFEHHIISLTDATEFQSRIEPGRAVVHTLRKNPGKDIGMYWRLFKLLRRLKPHVVHTRNFGTVDCLLIARFSGVRKLIHSEHGWDVSDLNGTVKKYIRLRRWMSYLTRQIVSVSRHIQTWLHDTVGITSSKLLQIYNGVDSERFVPVQRAPTEELVVGFVGRLEPVKNLESLLRAVHALVAQQDSGRVIRVKIVGDGSERARLQVLAKELQIEPHIEFLGARKDIDACMQSFDVFILPSLNEGISNTILEAMATGLPVVAARVGGNVELVQDDVNGVLYDSGDVRQIATALRRYSCDEGLRAAHGEASRHRITELFTLDKMVQNYAALYRSVAMNT